MMQINAAFIKINRDILKLDTYWLDLVGILIAKDNIITKKDLKRLHIPYKMQQVGVHGGDQSVFGLNSISDQSALVPACTPDINLRLLARGLMRVQHRYIVW